MRSSTADLLTEEVANSSVDEDLKRGQMGPDELHALIILDYGRIDSIHHLETNSTSVGRSRSNDIVIDNPRFPRRAGDLILLPEPLFRTVEKGRASTRITRLKPRCEIPVRNGFKLLYLRPGESFRPKKRRVHLANSKFLPAVVVFALILVFGIFSLIDDVNTASRIPAEYGIDFDISQHLIRESKQDQSLALQTGLRSETKAAPTKSYSQITIQSSVKVSKAIFLVRNESKTRGSISETVYQRSLSAARLNLKAGDFKGTAQIVIPILEYLSKEQRKELVRELDVLLEPVYRSSYVIYAFDRERAGRNLEPLLESDLGFLPTHRKAKALSVRSKRKMLPTD
jgi:hypothetical protein